MFNKGRAFTPDMLAGRWASSSATVRNLCNGGKLEHIRMGLGLYRIPAASIVQFEGAEPMSDSDDKPLTPKLLGDRWQCSEAIIKKLCRQRALGHFLVGEKFRIPVEAVQAYEHNEPPPMLPDARGVTIRLKSTKSAK